MIGYLEGTVKRIRRDHLILLCGPVGYLVYVSAPSLYEEGQHLALYTHQQFKEDGQMLYGFEDEEVYQLFTLLIQVKGLGCKTVMSMLAHADGDTIIRAIENGDAAALKKLPGIGAKTAGQILLDLKGKIVLPESSSKKAEKTVSPEVGEVEEALLSLGYKQPEIDSINPSELAKEHPGVDALLRCCLKELARRKKGI